MTGQDTGDGANSLAEAISSGDWAKTKALMQKLASAPADATPESAERLALIAMLKGGAIDRLQARGDEAKGIWLSQQIIAAAGSKNKATAHKLALDLTALLARSGVPLDEDLALKVLKCLRDLRAFEALTRLGDRLMALGLTDPAIPKFVAQGFIDSGYPQAGLAVLQDMLDETAPDHPQRLDALGIAGRAHKQVYVDAVGAAGASRTGGMRAALLQSAACYEDSYLATRVRHLPDFAEWSYPAVNLVAVLNRAASDGISVPSRVKADEITGELIEGFQKLDPAKATAWDFATVGEAYVAKKDWGKAERWLHDYATRADVNAFQLGGTIRQLEEVWRLDSKDEVQGRILYFLKAQMLAKDGGQVSLTAQNRAQLLLAGPQAAGGPHLEIYLSDGRPKPVSWFQIGLERANSVGLMQRRSNRVGFATGFLVRGGDFIPHLGDEPVLLTNAHVISERASELNDPNVASVRPELAQVEFTQAGAGVRRRVFEVDRILWDSPRSELDACLVALKAPPSDIPFCQLSTNKPEAGKSRVIVIGHPGGERELKISLYEAPVTAVNTKGLLTDASDAARLFLHYNNPTIGGNSGSPVFDIDDWCVVGLHHAGSAAQSSDGGDGAQSRPAGNEGIYIRSVSEASSRGERTTVSMARSGGPGQGSAQGVPRAEAVGPSATDAALTQPGGKLAHDIPGGMLEGQPVVVCANISRVESDLLFAGLRAGSVSVHDVVPSAAMTVALRSAEGAFAIQPLTSETQWIDRLHGALDSVTTWKWSVTPLKPGRHDLSLVLQGREARGGIEAALPSLEQMIPVAVQVDRRARAMTTAKWAAVAAGGGVVSFLGQLAMKTFM